MARVEPSCQTPCTALDKQTPDAGYRVGNEDMRIPLRPNNGIALSKLKDQWSQRHHHEPVERRPYDVMQNRQKTAQRSVGSKDLARLKCDHSAPAKHRQSKLSQIALTKSQPRLKCCTRKLRRILHNMSGSKSSASNDDLPLRISRRSSRLRFTSRRQPFTPPNS